MSEMPLRELFDYRDGVLYWKAPRRGIRVGAVAGNPTHDGYCRVTIGGRQYYRHVLIWLMHHGYLPKAPNEVDHRDRDRSNDRIENLREVTKSQNQWNTDARGYCWDESHGKWRAQICVSRKSTHLGNFDTEGEARAAYLAAKAVYHQVAS